MHFTVDFTDPIDIIRYPASRRSLLKAVFEIFGLDVLAHSRRSSRQDQKTVVRDGVKFQPSSVPREVHHTIGEEHNPSPSFCC